MSVHYSMVCDNCYAVNPDRVFFRQDTEQVIGCSDCTEFCDYADDQYDRLQKASV